ncbi:MAG: cysteine hydrolase [Candidatus Dojkabacteria bacterium]|nr:cysteine hydrolase [Candidatus Dojkabacteria bacterium]
MLNISQSILVVIDMQQIFLRNIQNHQNLTTLVDNICKRIDFYKKHLRPIFIVEYYIHDEEDFRIQTIGKILNRVSNYPLTWFILKERDSACPEILQIVNKEVQLDYLLFNHGFVGQKREYFENHVLSLAMKKNIHLLSDYSFMRFISFECVGVNASCCVLQTAFDLSLSDHNFSSFISAPCAYDVYTSEWPHQNVVFQEEEIKNKVNLIYV